MVVDRKRLLQVLIAVDDPIGHVHDPRPVVGDLLRVGHTDDQFATGHDIVHQRQDFLGVLRIQRPGRFVGNDDVGIRLVKPIYFKDQHEYRLGLTLDDPIDVNELFIPIHDLRKYVKVHPFQDINNLQLEDI
ncbi:hypothetical protein [Levilactobacillus brevis]|uniref:hypothetical protein n=1 Tax=Levilactobacillus brevis TaxID=1580 RepID=UPI0022E4BD8A|nr:hypothetical protein [Levilactobacillus brevis]